MSSVQEDSIRLTEEILKEAVINYEKLPGDDIKIISHKFEPGSEKGDNFTCSMYRILIKALIKTETKEYDFIAKVIPLLEMRAMMVKVSKMFDIEVFFYTKIAPKLKEYAQKTKNVQLKVAECYYASSESGVLIFDNLKKYGFKMINKKLGFDEDHLYLVLEQLAHLHGFTYHYLQKEELEPLKDVTILREKFVDSEVIQNLMDGIFLDTVETTIKLLEKKNYPEFAKKLERYATKGAVMGAFEEDLVTDLSGFNVILHGDCWSNNYLFNYGKDGKVSEVKAVDMQLMRINRPIVDILHVLCAGTDPTIREKKEKDWINFYYDKFVSILSELGYDGPALYSKEMCERDVQKARRYGFFLGLFMCQGILTDEAKEGGMLDIDKMYKCKDHEEMRQLMQKMTIETIDKYPVVTERMIQLVKEADRNNAI